MLSKSCIPIGYFIVCPIIHSLLVRTLQMYNKKSGKAKKLCTVVVTIITIIFFCFCCCSSPIVLFLIKKERTIGEDVFSFTFTFPFFMFTLKGHI